MYTCAVHQLVETDLTDQREVMPSIVHVQKSCLMTLNNILSAQHSTWSPIVPDRRHSTPATAKSAASQADFPLKPTSELQILLTNLRSRDSSEGLEDRDSQDDTQLIEELRLRVDAMALSLTPDDAQLARALVSLIADFDRTSTIRSKAAGPSAGFHSHYHDVTDRTSSPTNVYNVLKRQLSNLQAERQTNGDTISSGSPPILAVESALLWSKIDDELEAVLSLCRERTERLPSASLDSYLPPQYDRGDYSHDEDLPKYDYGSRASINSLESKGRQSLQINTTSNAEKMRLDLEAVTMAIDRLYIAVPQLHNQRVELKSSKLAAMEEARTLGGRSAVSEGKRKEWDLDHMMDLLDKASDRKMTDQIVVIEGGMGPRMEKARQRDQAKQEAFVSQLATHSKAGRLHGQDAVLDTARMQDPERQRMTLPEFLRAESQSSFNPTPARPETAPGPPGRAVTKKPSFARLRKKSRSRSMSAPSLSWLRPSTSRSSEASAAKDEFKQMRTSKSGPLAPSAGAPALHCAFS